MSNDILIFNNRTLRGADSNSLLRIYDLAHELFNKSVSSQERTRADRALQRIAQELHKRNVRL